MLTRGFLFILILVLGLTSFADTAIAETKHFCTREHMTRAIALNKERIPRYQELTDGQSLKISKKLIHLEYGLLLLSPPADLASIPYQNAGVPLLCAEYVSMDTVPQFRKQAPLPWPKLKNYKSLELSPLRKELGAAIFTKNFKRILEISKAGIAELNQEPQFNCLTRHFLESIARAAALAPKQNALALAKVKLPSLEISRQFILSHLAVLGIARQIDTLAAPLQAAGVPIVCQDVPPIPVP